MGASKVGHNLGALRQVNPATGSSNSPLPVASIIWAIACCVAAFGAGHCAGPTPLGGGDGIRLEGAACGRRAVEPAGAAFRAAARAVRLRAYCAAACAPMFGQSGERIVHRRSTVGGR